MVTISVLSGTVFKYGGVALATAFGSLILEKLGKKDIAQALSITMYVVMGVCALDLFYNYAMDIYHIVSSWRWDMTL